MGTGCSWGIVVTQEPQVYKAAVSQHVASLSGTFCCNSILISTMEKGFDSWINLLLSACAHTTLYDSRDSAEDEHGCWHIVLCSHMP